MAKSVQRKIYFYRMNAGFDKSGKHIPFNPIATLQHINNLPFSFSDGRYHTISDGRILCCWIDRLESPSRVRIAAIRREDLPQIEQAGTLSPLSIPEQSGVIEQTHLVFFDNNLLGAEYNFYGPRPPLLPYYLAQKARGVCPPGLDMEALLRHDISAQLDQLNTLRLFSMKAHASYAKSIATIDDSLAQVFIAAQKAGEAQEIEIVLRPGQRSRGWLNDKLLSTTKALVKRGDLRTEVARLEVRGFDRVKEKLVTLNLLNDKLISQKSIVKLDKRSKALNSDSAYSAIESAFKELHKQLEVSTGVG